MMYGRNTSRDSFSRNVGIGSSVGDDMTTRRMSLYEYGCSSVSDDLAVRWNMGGAPCLCAQCRRVQISPFPRRTS